MFEIAIYVGMFVGMPATWVVGSLFIAGEILPPRERGRNISYTDKQPLTQRAS